MPTRREAESSVSAAEAEPRSSAATAGAWLVTAGVVVVPLICAPDLIDRFRIIKESAARAEAILGLFLIVVAVTFGGGMERVREILRERLVVGFALAGLAWAVVTTLTSTHRAHSMESLVTVSTSVLLVFVVWFFAPRVRWLAIDLLVPVAVINVAVAAMQEYGIWNPFAAHEDIPRHLTASGLLGNPNIVGSYLALVTIILTVAAICVGGWRRAWYAGGAAIAAGGVLVSETETAVITVAAGLFVVAVGKSVKRAGIAVAVVAALAAGALAMRVPVVVELASLPDRIRERGLEATLSGRVAPALVALEMTRERPLVGFGPGTYGYHFMPQRIALAARSGTVDSRAARGFGTNFGEVHNDHLEIMAESGVPGYVLFVGFLAGIWRSVRNADGTSARATFAKKVAGPLTIGLMVLALAQFPLQIAATRHLLITIAGVALGWRRDG